MPGLRFWKRLSRPSRRRVFEVTALSIAVVTLIGATVWMQHLSTEVEPSDWDNPNEYSSGELVGAPSNFDGDTVTFRGEAVGDAMVRADGAWIHLNDDPYSERPIPDGGTLSGYNSGLPVWVHDTESIERISRWGSYRAVGDIVEVRGVFNAACTEHGGDIDLHATSLSVVEPGREVVVEAPLWKAILAAALAVVVLLMWRALRWRAVRERTHGDGR